jgi:hypothetical protein
VFWKYLAATGSNSYSQIVLSFAQLSGLLVVVDVLEKFSSKTEALNGQLPALVSFQT